MRHQNKRHRIGSTPSHRTAMLRNLAIEVIDHGKIKTTHTRCMAARGMIEKLITLAKVDTVANRRKALSKLDNMDAVTGLFTKVAPRFIGRNGGYTRIHKLADGRVGDAAKMSLLSFVE